MMDSAFHPEGSSMNTYSKLLLAFLFLILAIFAAGGCGPPENGPYVQYFENGQKSEEGNYKNGKYDGLMTQWYENGKKKLEGHYKNGKQEGLWTEWDEDGKKIEERHYKNGEVVSRKDF